MPTLECRVQDQPRRAGVAWPGPHGLAPGQAGCRAAQRAAQVRRGASITLGPLQEGSVCTDPQSVALCAQHLRGRHQPGARAAAQGPHLRPPRQAFQLVVSSRRCVPRPCPHRPFSAPPSSHPLGPRADTPCPPPAPAPPLEAEGRSGSGSRWGLSRVAALAGHPVRQWGGWEACSGLEGEPESPPLGLECQPAPQGLSHQLSLSLLWCPATPPRAAWL